MSGFRAIFTPMEVTLTSNSITIKETSYSTTLMGENLSRVEYASGVLPYSGTTVVNIYNLAGTVVGVIPLDGSVTNQRAWTNDSKGWQQAIDDISVIIGKPSTTGGGGGTVDTVQPGTGIDVDSTDPANPVVSQAASGVTPGSYTNANVTVDDRGRVTAASSGSAGSGDVTGPASSTTDHIALFADGTGKVIKDAGIGLDGVVTDDGNPSGVSPISSGSGVSPIELRRFVDGTGTEAQANTGSVQYNLKFSAADKFYYGGPAAAPTEGDITAAGRALLDDASAADQRTTLGVAPAAKGNLFSATGANAPSFLSVGADSQLLVADSSTSTGLSWHYRELVFTFYRTPTTITNIPAAVTFLSGANPGLRTSLFNLEGRRQARLMTFVTTAGNAGSKIVARYRTTYSATASGYLTLGTSEVATVLTTGGDIWVDSGWIDIVAGARLGDIFVGLFSLDGNGTADPVTQSTNLYFR